MLKNVLPLAANLLKKIKELKATTYQEIVSILKYKKTKIENRTTIKAMASILEYRTQEASYTPINTISGIIFSKDRPVQLDALLRSYQINSNPLNKFNVIFKASTSVIKNIYKEVFFKHQNMLEKIIEETCFKKELIQIIESTLTEKIFFLVDDIIFVRPVFWEKILFYSSKQFVFSLRLGKHLSFCYTKNVKQRLPIFEVIEKQPSSEFLYWKWQNGKHDWAYPLSLDGHIFDRQEILCMIVNTEFNKPNSLESSLQRFNPIFDYRYGVCFKKSRLFNIPLNRVQNEAKNKSGKEWNSNKLIEMWSKEKEIDVLELQGYLNTSCHQEIDIKFRKR